jgi:hypothetical protein
MPKNDISVSLNERLAALVPVTRYKHETAIIEIIAILTVEKRGCRWLLDIKRFSGII